MRASYTGQDAGLRTAAAYINDRLNSDQSFWNSIRNKPSFDLATITPAEIANRLQSSTSTITIVLWTPKPAEAYKYDDTIALVDSRHPRKLFYHTKFQDRRVAKKVNTIVHEYVHSVDAFDDGQPGAQMGHGDNKPNGKGDTAPYWIGDLAERVYERPSFLSAGLGSLLIETGNSDDGVVIQEESEPLRSYDTERGHTRLNLREGGMGAVALGATLAIAALGFFSVNRQRRKDR